MLRVEFPCVQKDLQWILKENIFFKSGLDEIKLWRIFGKRR